MTDELKTIVLAAVTAAVETVQTSQKEAEIEADKTISEPHKFGCFRVPAGTHIKGFDKIVSSDIT